MSTTLKIVPVIQQTQFFPARQASSRTFTFREFWPLHTQHPEILLQLLQSFQRDADRKPHPIAVGVKYQIINPTTLYEQVSEFLQEEYPRLTSPDITWLSRFLTAYHQELMPSAV